VRETTPSRTAAWVAAMRGIGPMLPRELRLCDDPYGLRFAGGAFARLDTAGKCHPRLTPILAAPAVGRALRSTLMIQLRTQALDQVVLEFVRSSGRQLVILGAGYDARAWRFSRELEGGQVFEVDHPATQGRKRRILGEASAPPAPVHFLAWNFERQSLDELPARLREVGHDPSLRTLTIWEGVTPYLTVEAIDATVRAVRALSAPGSLLAWTYLDRKGLNSRNGRARVRRWLLERWGEPFRTGFDPAEIPAWLRSHRFSLTSDETLAERGAHLLPARYARLARGGRFRHVAIARAL
jgi:methyltransferase (TIGR00027 family)